MGKLSRKKKSVEDTAELDMLADTLEDEIIDLVDPVEETAPAPDAVPTSKKEPAGTLDGDVVICIKVDIIVNIGNVDAIPQDVKMHVYFHHDPHVVMISK